MMRVASFVLFGAVTRAAPLGCPGSTTAEEVLRSIDLTGKRVIVTGGDEGLGRSIVETLLKRGAGVTIASRSPTRGPAAAEELKFLGSIAWRHLDLGELSSVRNFSSQFLSEEGARLDLLVNNAGIAGPSFHTSDGFESVFEIDYLGHFLLTELMLPALRASAPSRVINVASGEHADACSEAGWPKDCFRNWRFIPPPPVRATAGTYGAAKFLQIQHAAALARREEKSGVIAVSLTPGFADTAMTRSVSDEERAEICSSQAGIEGYPCPFTPQQATAVVAFVASAPVQSGSYYSRRADCNPIEPSMQGFTRMMQDELYVKSLRWAGISGQAPLSLPTACPGNVTAKEVLRGSDLRSRVALITGGDVGLGRAMASALLHQGAKVAIASRNPILGRQAAKELRQETGGDVTWLQVDLGSLNSVRSFAAQFLSDHKALHLLINNAGIDSPSYLTSDGFESVFEIDYLGHFLLTELLMPTLRSSAPSRVINVASGAHASACTDAGWPENCFKDWKYFPPPVVHGTVKMSFGSDSVLEPASSYGVAKFAQIQHAAALAKREAGTGVLAISLTPGFGLTRMTKNMDPKEEALICADQASAGYACPFSAEQDAAVIAFGAVADVQSGLYYNRGYDCSAVQPQQHGFTSEMQEEFFARSLRWSGLRNESSTFTQGTSLLVSFV